MATIVNERVDDPSEANVDYYVGLEHLDSDSLTISRWGSPADVEATKLRFRAGDIIFGRRRVYQRKLGVAQFDGICSAHAMVLRPKPEVVLPQFLPFFMQSDLFMERAKEISVGSLSPTINWRTLAKEEFALPPMEEQQRIAKVLTAIWVTEDSHSRTTSALRTALEALVSEMLMEVQASTVPSPLEEHADVQYGLTVSPERRKGDEQIPYLRVANVLRGDLDLAEIKSVGKLPGDNVYRLIAGDVLVVEGHANAEQIGRAAVWNDERSEMFHQNHLIRVRCAKSLNPDYLCLLVNSLHGQAYFRSRAKSTSGLSTINSTVVKHYRLPVPEPTIQLGMIERFRAGRRLLQEVANRRNDLERIRLAVRNRFYEEPK
jgi:restriction endonuclease S subunit